MALLRCGVGAYWVNILYELGVKARKLQQSGLRHKCIWPNTSLPTYRLTLLTPWGLLHVKGRQLHIYSGHGQRQTQWGLLHIKGSQLHIYSGHGQRKTQWGLLHVKGRQLHIYSGHGQRQTQWGLLHVKGRQPHIYFTHGQRQIIKTENSGSLCTRLTCVCV